MTLISRQPFLAPNVVFVDGMSGSGKTAISFILSALERVEIHRIDPIYEQVCTFNYLGRIPNDAAEALIRLQTDITIYDVMLARGSNFRPGDVSSVLLKKELYESRLHMTDGKEVLERIQKEKPFLHLMMHQTFGISAPLFHALGERCFLIEMVRSPIFLITAWDGYIERYGKDPLEFDVCFRYQNHDLPWFAQGWEKEYLETSSIDRIILSLQKLFDLRKKFLEGVGAQFQNQILTIPFKKLVLNPWPFIEEIEKRLQTKRTPLLEEVLKKQKIPRQVLTDVPDHEAFRKYGWNPLKTDTTEESELEKLWKSVKKRASSQAYSILEKICSEYEATYLKPDHAI